jgi:hypothetical protein
MQRHRISLITRTRLDPAHFSEYTGRRNRPMPSKYYTPFRTIHRICNLHFSAIMLTLIGCPCAPPLCPSCRPIIHGVVTLRQSHSHTISDGPAVPLPRNRQLHSMTYLFRPGVVGLKYSQLSSVVGDPSSPAFTILRSRSSNHDGRGTAGI